MSCGKDKKVQNQNEYDQVKLQREKVVSDLAKKYNALIDWDKDKIIYTVQLQQSFLNDKPVLAVGYVDDVYIKDDQFYVRFANSMSVEELKNYGIVLRPEINFILRCDSVQVSRVFSNLQGNSYPEFNKPMYAFVALIGDVTKPVLKIDGSVSDNTVELSYEPPQTFIATGDCIDLVYVGQEFL